MENMFVVVIEYIKPIAEVDAARPPHLEWIGKHVADGTFLFSGRQPSGAGGCVIANVSSRAALDAILNEDGYIKAGVAKHNVIEFDAKNGSLMSALPQAAAH
jgi:uncharacterized protein YciI